MKKLKKTDTRRPSLLPNILEMDDNRDYSQTRNLPYLSSCPTSPTSPEILERLHQKNESPFQFPHIYQHSNQQQNVSDVDSVHSMYSSNLPSTRFKCSEEKELRAILREIRVITDKIRMEVRTKVTSTVKLIANLV